MVKFESDYSEEKLINRWDEHTSISRFAGSDDTMDLIYVSKRNGNKIRLIRKAPLAREPFSTVFRGFIRKTEKGSEIVGIFTKSVFDYILVALILVILFYVRSYVINRGDEITTINTLLVFAIAGSLMCLYNYRTTKRKFADFISRITGKDNKLFLTKTEMKENEDQ